MTPPPPPPRPLGHEVVLIVVATVVGEACLALRGWLKREHEAPLARQRRPTSDGA